MNEWTKNTWQNYAQALNRRHGRAGPERRRVFVRFLADTAIRKSFLAEIRFGSIWEEGKISGVCGARSAIRRFRVVPVQDCGCLVLIPLKSEDREGA
jgi:hypothetical protein